MGVALAQLFRWPHLSDPLGAPLPAGWQLRTPGLYTALAPFFSLWDNIAMLSRTRLSGFLVGGALAYVGWRVAVRLGRRVRLARAILAEVGSLLAGLAALLLFVGVGMAWNTRPSRVLAGLSTDELTVEIHSHTSASHDVRRWPVAGFDAEANRQWHQRAGVDLLFVTDHNTTAGWRVDAPEPLPGVTHLCPGIEISAAGAHVVVLGAPLPPDPAAYRGAAGNRARLFAEVARSSGAVAIASLPEYRGRAPDFAAEGVAGFEIVNASPKGNDISRPERDRVIALARGRGLVLVATGDQHGYGATPMAWNVVRSPAWRRSPANLCALVVARLRSGSPAAVRIAERTRLRPDHWLPGPLTPLGVVWLAWATLSPAAALSWVAWIWALVLGWSALRESLRRRRSRAIMSAVGTLIPPPPGPR